jgi:hypothetical protein
MFYPLRAHLRIISILFCLIFAFDVVRTDNDKVARNVSQVFSSFCVGIKSYCTVHNMPGQDINETLLHLAGYDWRYYSTVFSLYCFCYLYQNKMFEISSVNKMNCAFRDSLTRLVFHGFYWIDVLDMAASYFFFNLKVVVIFNNLKNICSTRI